MKQIKNLLCILLAVMMLVLTACISTYATEINLEITTPETSEKISLTDEEATQLFKNFFTFEVGEDEGYTARQVGNAGMYPIVLGFRPIGFDGEYTEVIGDYKVTSYFQGNYLFVCYENQLYIYSNAVDNGVVTIDEIYEGIDHEAVSGRFTFEKIAESTTQTVGTSETTDTTLPDCDSKPVTQDTTETTAETDPEEPDCDSKPVVIPTSDPTATTEEPSIPLTGPDGTAPTDPSETTAPTVTDPTETTVPTESTSETDPAETTEPTETTAPTETTQPDTTPKLNKKNLKLNAGETFTLKVKNSNGTRVRYSCDNTGVAIVSSSGKVTALKKGTAKITAKMGAQKFTCKVTVKTNPKLKKGGKVVTTLTLKVGERTKVNLVGKAESINNAYFNTPEAYFSALPTATKLSVIGRKVGTTTIKVRVNNTKYVKLKVIVK